MFKKSILAFIIIFFLSIATVSYAVNHKIKVVKKQASILAIDFPNKTMNELKQILLAKAKRMALSEIYGEMIHSKTEVQNFVLAHDLISAEALGIIRIKGTPKYYNGKNFGELCVLIEAFVTQEDLKKFKAKNVVIKRFCLNDPNIPFAKLKSKARKAAYIEIIKRHNPSLDNISMIEAKSVIHDFYVSNENLDVNTGAYCMDISANIIPIEIDILAGNSKSSKNKPIAKRKISNNKNTVKQSPKFEWKEATLGGNFYNNIPDSKDAWGSNVPILGIGNVFYSFGVGKVVGAGGDIWLEVCSPDKKISNVCFRLNGFWFMDLWSLTKITVPKDFGTQNWNKKEPKCMKVGHYYVMTNNKSWVLLQVLDFKGRASLSDCALKFRYLGPALNLEELNARLPLR